jgi:hypothetical protein
VSTLEASGYMAKIQDQLTVDEELSSNYQKAHESYLLERAEIAKVEEIEGISAGGMPTRIKCLHSLVAHSLAKGPGVNPVGDLALDQLTWSPKECTCV